MALRQHYNIVVHIGRVHHFGSCKRTLTVALEARKEKSKENKMERGEEHWCRDASA